MNVLSKLAYVVAGRIVISHGVPFAVESARSSEADLARISPHDLRKVALALLKVLAVVVVVGLFVPLVGHLFARELLARRRVTHGNVLAQTLAQVHVVAVLEAVRVGDAFRPLLRY